jgi:hypothetical protein
MFAVASSLDVRCPAARAHPERGLGPGHLTDLCQALRKEKRPYSSSLVRRGENLPPLAGAIVPETISPRGVIGSARHRGRIQVLGLAPDEFLAIFGRRLRSTIRTRIDSSEKSLGHQNLKLLSDLGPNVPIPRVEPPQLALKSVNFPETKRISGKFLNAREDIAEPTLRLWAESNHEIELGPTRAYDSPRHWQGAGDNSDPPTWGNETEVDATSPPTCPTSCRSERRPGLDRHRRKQPAMNCGEVPDSARSPVVLHQ